MNSPADLYFLTRSRLNELAGQCDCSDCDCACAPQMESGSLLSPPFAQHTRLYPLADIQIHALDAGNHMVVGGKSSLAVLSSGCLALLKSFPATTGEVLRQMAPRWGKEKVEQVIRGLLGHGLLVDDPLAARLAPDPPAHGLSAWIHLAGSCNLACHYCYVPNSAEKLSPATGRGIIDSIFRSAQAHHFSAVKLKYAGGEPLLNFPTLIENYRYARALGAEMGIAVEGKILTNGVLLNTAVLDRIAEHDLSLTISLDGTRAFHDANRPLRAGGGSFEKVEKGLKLALAHGLKPGISITISGASAPGLPALVEYLLDLDLRFTFNFYRENDLSKERQELNFDNRRLIDTLLETYRVIEARKPDFAFWNALGDRVNLQQAHSRPCSVGKNYLVFDVHGNLSRCQVEMETSLGDYTASDPLELIRAASGGLENIPVEHKPDCQGCTWNAWCAGGCPALARQISGSYSARSPYCDIYREIIPALLRLEAKSLLRAASYA